MEAERRVLQAADSLLRRGKCTEIRLQTRVPNTSAGSRNRQRERKRERAALWWTRVGGVRVWRMEVRTTLAPMLVCPLPSQGMDADTGIWGGAKGTELAWAMLV